ncbi:hypothetical protein FRAHR75_70076 [Frankia sp. Hr75.2]|nr:hypothetical protein FRAHR75_70076 [Frankia sp. Hr75.2]SQD94628.1 hypothetical protein FMEAI12_2680037 [Parafrankia sp. Ea1.12]
MPARIPARRRPAPPSALRRARHLAGGSHARPIKTRSRPGARLSADPDGSAQAERLDQPRSERKWLERPELWSSGAPSQ